MKICVLQWKELSDSYVKETPSIIKNMMRVDTKIKVLGLEILTKHLGLVEAERFVSLILKI